MLPRNSVYFYSTAAAVKLEADATNGVYNVDDGGILTDFLYEDDQVTTGLLFPTMCARN